ncbi:MAG: type II toxin-antitoxin system RatA family toxin [Pseudomonadota bacterium]
MTTHHETKFLPYAPDQMFDLIADVERYPEFIPWCSALRITDRKRDIDAEIIEADMVVSFQLFREKFRSRVRLEAPEKKIDIAYVDGPFNYLDSLWTCKPAEGGCLIDFSVDFEFKNIILQNTVGLFFGEAMQMIVGAFEARAHDLYG